MTSKIKTIELPGKSPAKIPDEADPDRSVSLAAIDKRMNEYVAAMGNSRVTPRVTKEKMPNYNFRRALALGGVVVALTGLVEVFSSKTAPKPDSVNIPGMISNAQANEGANLSPSRANQEPLITDQH